MKKTAIFYGSTTGTTESIANQVAEALGCPSINVNEGLDTVKEYDNLIFACSTWGLGELQDDWANQINSLSDYDFTGKKVSFIGTGDGASFSDTFVDAIGLIKKEIKGATFVGQVDTDTYDYSASLGEEDGKFLGLVIDISQDDKTDERVSHWVEQIKKEFE